MNVLNDTDLERHLRQTLAQVASAPISERSSQRGRLVIAAVAVAALAASGLAAWNALGPGEIDRVPVEAAILSGVADDGTEWWLIPTRDVFDTCNGEMPGVVFVSGALNRPGLEWNMGGVAYGEPPTSDRACSAYDEAAWLADPARADIAHQRLGPNDDRASDFGFYATVHPDVAALHVTVDGVRTFEVDTVDDRDPQSEGRFAAFTTPHDARQVDIVLLNRAGDPVTSRTVQLDG